MSLQDRTEPIKLRVAEGMVREARDPAGGTTDYLKLKNKPKINGVMLQGNKSLEDIGMNEITYSEILGMFKEW